MLNYKTARQAQLVGKTVVINTITKEFRSFDKAEEAFRFIGHGISEWREKGFNRKRDNSPGERITGGMLRRFAQ